MPVVRLSFKRASCSSQFSLTFLRRRSLPTSESQSSGVRSLLILLGSKRRLYLRIDEIPKQTWEVTNQLGSIGRLLVREVDTAPAHPSHKIALAPTLLSPRLIYLHQGLDGDQRLFGQTEMIALPPLQGLALGSYSSVLDTFICNPPCYEITFYLAFIFMPAIPSYSHLAVRHMAFRTDKALKLGEALAKSMTVHTEMVLVADRPGTAVSKRWSNVTANEILAKLQDEHQYTALVCAGDPGEG